MQLKSIESNQLNLMNLSKNMIKIVKKITNQKEIFDKLIAERISEI